MTPELKDIVLLAAVRVASPLDALSSRIGPNPLAGSLARMARGYGFEDTASFLATAESILDYKVFGRAPLCSSLDELCLRREWFDTEGEPPALGQPRLRGGHGNKVIVVDNFYQDPYAVRELALQAEYFPYNRTWLSTAMDRGAMKTSVRLVSDELLKLLGDICECEFEPLARQANPWNGAFHCKLAEAVAPACSIHSHEPTDIKKGWNGIVYLNPPGTYPADTGLSIWRDKSTGKCVAKEKQFNTRFDRFDLALRIENVFNRLVLIRSDVLHMGEAGFGASIAAGRLFQTFFLEMVDRPADAAD